MATFLVTNTNDSGPGSLRAAIQQANANSGADLILFSGSVFEDDTPDTITLTQGIMTLTDGATTAIVGPTSAPVIIDGNNNDGIFRIESAARAELSNLTITQGNGSNGGAVFNLGTLEVSDTHIVGNQASVNGGGIFNVGTLTLTHSTLNNNSAINGGGIQNSGNMVVRNSTVSGNLANLGGGIFNGSNLVLTNSTVTANTSSMGNGSGIATVGNANVSTAVGNGLVAGNTNSDLDIVVGAVNSIVNNGGNLVGSGTAASAFSDDERFTGNISEVIGPLTNNGGRTPTHALVDSLTNPAVDGGLNANVPPGSTTDQRGSGFNRIARDLVDVGAVELQRLTQPGAIAFLNSAFSAPEENDGVQPVVVATLERVGGSDGVVTVDVVYVPGGSATPGDDFVNTLPLTVTFEEGETLQSVVLPIVGNTVFEPDKTIGLALQNPTGGATLGSQTTTTFTILNDDPVPTVSISPLTLSLPEGDVGATPFVFQVGLSNPSAEPVTVAFTTVDGTATAVDNDYVPASGTLTFSPGEVTQEITVTVVGDTQVEPDERFTVQLSEISGAIAGNTIAEAIILNDDEEIIPILPTVSLSPLTAEVSEGNSGTTPLNFTVTLSDATTKSVTVSFTTDDGTATAGDNDYLPVSGTLTFLPGAPLSQTLTVEVVGDLLMEPDETFSLRLTAATNAELEDTTATITILNDDEEIIPILPTVSLSPLTAEVSEGNSGTTPLNFTVTLSDATTELVTVSFTTDDGTATAGDNDYLPVSGTLTFLPGAPLSQTLTVEVVGDLLMEPDETFSLRLTAATNAELEDTTATITILNDDEPSEPIQLSGKGGQFIFDVTAGSGLTTIADFGGVGRGARPLAPILAEIDTIRFRGDGLVARNMRLTQTGADLHITFDGVVDTTVVLTNFQLELLENLRRNTGASVNLGNTIFDNETTFEDSFDVFDADSTQTFIWNRNTVTFLNNLNNSVTGLALSNDVINGLGGDDVIDGLSGNDLLRGGPDHDVLYGNVGDDTLMGGMGNDVLVGGSGSDVLMGGVGADSFVFASNRAFRSEDLGLDWVMDFEVGTDKLVLDKTTFSQLQSAVGGGLSADLDFEVVGNDAAAAQGSALIVYSQGTGNLFYNENRGEAGFGAGAQFASLNGAPGLNPQDFLVQG
ncbi:MAG: hypothetical protein KME20_00565 [Kaiparowitsia implicata GSE-PSE-MK54-09C]|jgi:Ca2+-binding RTX toxin-like protein|nr:hypothetical protein [Kaiparowitsia implicata GSE-PSE-MK54-09C]